SPSCRRLNGRSGSSGSSTRATRWQGSPEEGSLGCSACEAVSNPRRRRSSTPLAPGSGTTDDLTRGCGTMKRAAVVIGVDKTGDLPRLKDAARGAQLTASWAREQGMDPVHVFTDEKKKLVDVSAIKTAIRELVDAANISQLLIYFAGHGVNRQRHEYWLLSDAH